MSIFSDARGQQTPHSMVGSGRNSNSFEILWLTTLPARKKKKNYQNEGARVLTRLYIDFSDAQGQLIPQSVVESGRNSTASEILWLSSLPERMKKIR